MSRLIVILAALIAPLAAGAGGLEGQPAPDFTLRSIDGGNLKLSDVTRDRPVVLVFWATWCPYCKALLPHLQSILDEHGPERVEVIAVDVFEEAGADPAGYMREAGFDFRTLLSGDAIAAEWGVRGTPGLFVIARGGTVVYDRFAHRADLPARRSRDEPDAALSHRQKAARIAPFWAAQARLALSTALD